MDKWQACPLFKWCPSKTAACRVCLPDDGCYWYRWFEQLIKGNLTMEKNPIKITIENYCGQIVTFTMSPDAEIESSLCIIDDKVTEVHINGYDKDILIEKEDI